MELGHTWETFAGASLQRGHALLDQPTAEMSVLRGLLTRDRSFPFRRTWERRLKALPASLSTQIGCLGRHLLDLIQPWVTCGRAVASDSTVLRARGDIDQSRDSLVLSSYDGCVSSWALRSAGSMTRSSKVASKSARSV